MVSKKIKNKRSLVDWVALTLRAKLVLMAMLFVVLLFAWYGLVSWHQGSRLAQQQRQHQQLLQNQQRLKNRLLRMEKTIHTLAALKNKRAQFMQALPPESQIHQVLEKISRLGAKQKLRFIYFRPQAEKQRDFYMVMPIQVAVFGDYHQLANFIAALANMPQLVTVGALTVMREDQADGLLRMNMVVNVYSDAEKVDAEGQS